MGKMRILLASLLIMALAQVVQAGDWPMFRHDLKHSGIADEVVEPPLKLEWYYKTGDYVMSSPAVSDSVLYVGSMDYNVYALDTNTGNLYWKYQTGGNVDSSPAVSEGVVYVGSSDGYIYALDASTGNQKWKYKIGTSEGNSNALDSSPAVSEGVVYVAYNDYVYALDANTGSLIFKSEDIGYGIYHSSPAVSGGTVYIGSGNGFMYALDASTGSLKWNYKTGGDIDSSPAVSDGIIYVGSWDDNVYAIYASTGSLKWKYQTGGNVRSSPAISRDVVYVGSSDGYVYALDASTGNLEWKYQTGDSVISSPAVSSSTVYVGSGDNFYALDASTGKTTWKFEAFGVIVDSSPAVSGSMVYVGSNGGTNSGYVYALKPYTPTPSTGSFSVISVPSGATIYLDGIYKGTTPMTIADVPAGNHSIEIKLDGYNPWSDSVNVVAGGTSTVSAPLTPSPIVNITSTVSENLTSSAITPSVTTPSQPTTSKPTPSQTLSPPPEPEGIDWTLVGGAIIGLLVIGAVALSMRKPKETAYRVTPEYDLQPIIPHINRLVQTQPNPLEVIEDFYNYLQMQSFKLTPELKEKIRQKIQEISRESSTLGKKQELEAKLFGVPAAKSTNIQSGPAVIPQPKVPEGAKCQVCISEFSTAEPGAVKCPHCNNLFHYRCITKWVNKNKVCPICKKEVSV